jgi:hypothetical protein
LEVDLLITTPAWVWGLEVKTSRHANAAQVASLRRVAGQFGEQWRGGLLVYQGGQLQRLDPNLWAVPVTRLLSAQ